MRLRWQRGPSDEDIEQAIWDHYDTNMMFSLQYIDLTTIKVTDVGKSHEEGSQEYWPIKVNLTTDGLLGESTRESKLVVIKDRWGDWIVEWSARN